MRHEPVAHRPQLGVNEVGDGGSGGPARPKRRFPPVLESNGPLTDLGHTGKATRR
jgi:hypothetical protein